MTSPPLDRDYLLAYALKRVPPLIRKSLLSDHDFIEKTDFKAEPIVSFGSCELSFRRSDFFNAVRALLGGEAFVELLNTEGRALRLINDSLEDEPFELVLLFDGKRYSLPDFSVLSGDALVRIRSLERLFSDRGLVSWGQEGWREILEERSLEDDEVDEFYCDFRDTPDYVAMSIRNEVSNGGGSVSSLVPNSRIYFERLVGVYDGSASIQDYAAGAGRDYLASLSCLRPFDGFIGSLFLSSHSSITDEISVDNLSPEELNCAFDYLEKHGDLLSRLGAIEVGLRILPSRQEIEPFLLRLIDLVRGDELEGGRSEFEVLSALFVLVDGELARTRLMAGEPPFYRRLASLAQAALIHRQLVSCAVDYKQFSDWALKVRGEQFYMQSLADMRAEPRWGPDSAASHQFQAEFFGRIMIAATRFQEGLGEGELRDVVLGDGPGSLLQLSDFPRPYFPGPLEGAADSPNNLPDGLAVVIEEQLNSDQVEAASFIALVNSAKIFRVAPGHVELAAKALRLGNYTLANVENKSQLLSILSGLATVAAVSRNSSLADELRILVRRYQRDSQYGFSVEEAMRICLMASAAKEDLVEWRTFSGGWLTELAFGDLEEGEGEVLYSRLQSLLHSVPELWVSCSKAVAALQAWCFR